MRHRHLAMVGGLCLFTLAAACAGSGRPSARVTRPPAAAAADTASAPATIVRGSTRRELGKVDPACNGGRGIHLEADQGYVDQIVTVETSRGLTLVAFDTMTSGDSPIGRALIYAITARCTIDRSFGSDGSVSPSIPGVAASTGFGLASGRDGKFFVLSGRRRMTLIGEFDRNGSIDTSFGVRGWASFVAPGGVAHYGAYVADMIQEPDGNILAFANNAEAHYETRAYVFDLHADGTVDRGFGDEGHLSVFPRMTYAWQVLDEPDGSIALTGSLGGGGCYTMPIEWLTADGVPETQADANYIAAHSFPSKLASSATNFVDPAGGVGVIGEVTPDCDRIHRSARPYEAIEELNPDGSPDRHFGHDGMLRIATTNSANFDFSATQTGEGHLVLQGYGSGDDPYLYLQDLEKDGSTVPGFGHHGVVRLRFPELDNNQEAIPADVLSGPNGDIMIAAPVGNGVTIEEIAS